MREPTFANLHTLTNMCRWRTLEDTPVWPLVLLEMMIKNFLSEYMVGLSKEHKIFKSSKFEVMMRSHDVNISTVPPNIAGDRGVQDVSVLKNRQVTFECKSDAVPPPALSWLKDGVPLKVSFLLFRFIGILSVHTVYCMFSLTSFCITDTLSSKC